MPADEVADKPLHPGFASSWAQLRPLLDVRPAVVVDAANVVGSVPGRLVARSARCGRRRLIARIGALAADGIPAATLELPEHTWFPEWVVVVEGQARAAGDGANGVEVVRAAASGDDAIVARGRAARRRRAARSPW